MASSKKTNQKGGEDDVKSFTAHAFLVDKTIKGHPAMPPFFLFYPFPVFRPLA